MRKLSERQKAFCREYIIDFNATQAAIRAGYSEKGADVRGVELLGNSRIQDFLNNEISKRSEEAEVKAIDLIHFFNSVVVNVYEKTSDRIKAAENLAKRIGFYETHNNQKKTEINIPIESWVKK